MPIPFDDVGSEPGIHGWLHVPARPTGNAVVLTHGAGSNCQSALLIEMANAFSASGFTVLRFDLPFRRARLHGPPFPVSAVHDRDGLRRAVTIMRERKYRHVFLGGHSYGGRQASILVSEEPEAADGLLLLSYPLHPPRKPNELRTSHFPKLTTPLFFVHGTRDQFGTTAEMNSALELIPGPHTMLEVEGAGHDLLSKKNGKEVPPRVVAEFEKFLRTFTKVS
jgi:predicted alpha/beta-hydrolase family hydrolase